MAIKKLDPSVRFRLICEFDDALISENKEELAALNSGIKMPDGEDIIAPTRYQQYLENLDESKLKFREGAKPSYFVFRCLTNREMGELQEKYFDYDVKAKRQTFKGAKTSYFAELFEIGVLGIEDDSGKVVPVGPNEIGIGVMVNIGSAINIYTQLGKNLKK